VLRILRTVRGGIKKGVLGVTRESQSGSGIVGAYMIKGSEKSGKLSKIVKPSKQSSPRRGKKSQLNLVYRREGGRSKF